MSGHVSGFPVENAGTIAGMARRKRPFAGLPRERSFDIEAPKREID
jgi:hypothetical protein